MEFKEEHLFYFHHENFTHIPRSAGFIDIHISKGCKILTWEFITGHFIKFPVSLVTPTVKPSLMVLPGRMPRRHEDNSL